MRKLFTILALAVALALPTSALAVTAGGTTAESITLASTISLTVPASVAYTVTGGVASANVDLSNIATDNALGLTVFATFSAVTGPATIGVAQRQWQHNGGGDTWTGTTTDYAYGAITDAGQGYSIAASIAPVAPKTLSYASAIRTVTIPGTYSGSIAFSAVTN